MGYPRVVLTLVPCVQAEHLDVPLLSELLVYGLCGGPVVWMIAVTLWRTFYNLQLARSARRSELTGRSDHSRDTGYHTDTVVTGSVEVDPSHGVAIRTEIDQQGSCWLYKGKTQYKWEETARRVVARPFSLRLDDGALVDVEPSEDALVVDPLDQVKVHDPSHRTIAAEFKQGERVRVVGRLFEKGMPDATGGNYRGSVLRRQVLRSPPRSRMLLSSEPLGARFRNRARFHARWLAAACLVLVLVQCGLLSAYNMRKWMGITVTGTVTKKEHVKGGKTSMDYVWVRRDDNGAVVRLDAASRCFRKLNPGDQVNAVFASDWEPASQLGPRPTAPVAMSGLLGVFVVAFALVFRNVRRLTRPWYEQKKVTNTGQGSLDPQLLPKR